MIGDLFSKLQEARQKIEESKIKLNDIIVESSNNDGSIKVITSIEISEEFMKSGSKEEIQEQLLTALNNALEEAARKGEAEMKEITKDMLPNFPGLV